MGDTSIDSCDEGIYTQQAPSTSSGDLVYEGLKAIRRCIDKYEHNLMETESKARVTDFIAKQWKETAHVMDRFLFVLYLLLTTISLGLLFPKPHMD